MSLLFLLQSLIAHDPGLCVEAIDSNDPIIYIAQPELLVDKKHGREDVLNNLVMTNAPSHANSSFLKGYGDIKVFNMYNVSLLNDCDYDVDPLYCSVHNNHWMLKTQITETTDYAAINLILFNESGIIISTSSRSRKKKRVCDIQTKETNIRGQGPKGTYSQKIEETESGDCRDIMPQIVFDDLNQAFMSLYLGVPTKY